MSDLRKTVELTQLAKYRFEAHYPDPPGGPLVLDEPSPTGGGAGLNPVQTLATAIGHCMSSTLVSTLERAHVEVAPIRTVVELEVGRNDRERLRVRRISVQILTAPLHAEDQGRIDRCVSIFEDFCTVTGSVREGIAVESRVAPSAR